MKSLNRLVVPVALLITLAATPTRAGDQPKPGEHEWDYGKERGPARWGVLKPEFATCRSGHHQSPIDIGRTQAADLPPLEFAYRPSPLHIVDNGHTIMVSYEPGSSLRVGDRQFTLKQFHFHRPSEERIHGQGYEMSVHLVHADSAGQLAVVAVLLQRGNEQPLVRTLWKALPTEKEKEEAPNGIEVNAADLLPPEYGYYTFEGSLTTPPCSENVTWFVLKEPVPVSAEEVAQFSKLYRDNARPIQPVHDRVVQETR
jgi:carbonic anhydrase